LILNKQIYLPIASQIVTNSFLLSNYQREAI
jgi:hypothetical protein